ncbi:hypothetical protein GCM10009551_075290 [Nocardiopsis tropica]
MSVITPPYSDITYLSDISFLEGASRSRQERVKLPVLRSHSDLASSPMTFLLILLGVLLILRLVNELYYRRSDRRVIQPR